MKAQFALIICLSAIFALSPFAIDMYLPALPIMAESLNSTADLMEASVAVFLLGYALSQLILGPVSDRVGRLPVLIVGVAVYAVGSFLCAIASSGTELLAYRFLQALGGGASVAVYALINDRFNEKQSAQVISYVMAVVVIAPLIAPIIGSQLLLQFGWQSIFYTLAGLAALTVASSHFLLRARGKKTISTNHQASNFKDLLANYRQVLSTPEVTLNIFAGAFAFSGLFAFIAGSPFVYIEYFGVNEQHYAYLVGLNAVSMIGINLLNARVLHNVPPTRKVILGSFLIGLTSLGLVFVDMIQLGLAATVVGIIIYVGLLGLISSNSVAAAMAAAKNQAGIASSLQGVIMFGIGALSSAIVSGMESDSASAMIFVIAASGLLSSITGLILKRHHTKSNTANLDNPQIQLSNTISSSKT